MRRLAQTAAAVWILALLPVPLAPGGEPAGGKTPSRFTEEERKVIDRALRFERELVRLAEKVRARSVTIENWRTVGGALRLAGGGSGVIISSKGYILTNQHVANGAKRLVVVLADHRRVEARVVGRDQRGDVALLRIEARRIKYASPLRARPSRLRPGQWVVATGNPFFLAADGEAIISLGVVSGLGRISGGEYFYASSIQHDAEINPGNSGGPLWDVTGKLLGINGRIASNRVGGALGPNSSGVGYTIPVDQIRAYLEEMLEGRQRPKHGDELLGIQVVTAHDERGEPVGVRVTKVVPGSPAATARPHGVRVGDVIWKINVSGRPREVPTATAYYNLMSKLEEGKKVTLHIRRTDEKTKRTRSILIAGIELVDTSSGRRKGRGR